MKTIRDKFKNPDFLSKVVALTLLFVLGSAYAALTMDFLRKSLV